MALVDAFPVIVHRIPSKTHGLVAYEREPFSAKNALIFIGGLTEGPHDRLAVDVIAKKLRDSAPQNSSLWEFRMRSSCSGFGHSSLSNDVEDISALVAHLRTLGKEKIILCGSSTGCQDCLQYTNKDKYKSPLVDGYVLLNPVSDRETASLLMSPDDLDESIQHAQRMIAEGKQQDAMPSSLVPSVFTSPITAYRWNSLAAKGGDDDFFSADLDDTTIGNTFGRVDKPLLLLPGEEDELVPPSVDRKGLLNRWIQACPTGLVSKLSGFVPHGDHSISNTEAQMYVGDTVLQFLQELME